MFDLIEHSAMQNKKLKAAIKRLLSKDRKLIKMKDLRLLVKSNEELSDIKLTGKGRTKIAIVSDLEMRIKQKRKAKVVKNKKQKEPKEDDTDDEEVDTSAFVVDPNATYPVNNLAWDTWCIKMFIEKEEDKHYAKQLRKECHKQDFSDWEDVEKRVVGFKKEMMQHFDSIDWEFQRNSYRYATLLCTFEHDHYKIECPKVNEKEFIKAIGKQQNHSVYNAVDCWPEDEEDDLLCISEKKMREKMNTDPRKPQQVPLKSGNIVFVAAFDKKTCSFEGHGSGCLIDEKHVLTCAHNCHPLYDKAFENDTAWVIFSHNGSDIGFVETVTFPKSWPPSEKEFSSTKSSRDVAVLTLTEPIKSKFPYPVFGLALKKYEDSKKGANITVDGYPGIVGHVRVNGWDYHTESFVFRLVGDFGRVTKSGLSSRSLRSLAFFTPGTSGAPAMLCDDKGQYLTNGESPIIIGIAVSLGGERTEESTVCTPMLPWTLAFISAVIGKKVNVQNGYVRNQMACYMNKYKAQMKKYSFDDDVEMKSDD